MTADPHHDRSDSAPLDSAPLVNAVGSSGEASDTAAAVAEALRYGRHRRDLSQRELAAATGLSSTMVGRAETGDQSLSLQVLATLLGHLGLRLAVLNHDGEPLLLASSHEIVDRAGRHYPAHLDLRVVGEWGSWWGDLHDGGYVPGHNPRRPVFTFDQRALRGDRREFERQRAQRRRALRDESSARPVDE